MNCVCSSVKILRFIVVLKFYGQTSSFAVDGTIFDGGQRSGATVSSQSALWIDVWAPSNWSVGSALRSSSLGASTEELRREREIAMCHASSKDLFRRGFKVGRSTWSIVASISGEVILLELLFAFLCELFGFLLIDSSMNSLSFFAEFKWSVFNFICIYFQIYMNVRLG